MLTKKLNATIVIASQVLDFIIVLYFAVLLAKLVWWIINPSITDVYVEKSSATQFEKSIKYIANRHPFGIVPKVIEVKNVAPPIADLIKLTGVYFDPPHNSMAFIEYGGKDNKDDKDSNNAKDNTNSGNNGNKKLALKIGDSVVDNSATLTAINVDSIVVVQNGATATVNIVNHTDGGGRSSAFSGGHSLPPRPNMPAINNNSSNSQSYNSSNSNGLSTGVNSEEFKERRRKLISEFAKKSQATSSNQNNPNNDAAGGSNDVGNANANNNNGNVSSNNNGNMAVRPGNNFSTSGWNNTSGHSYDNSANDANQPNNNGNANNNAEGAGSTNQ